MKQWPSLAIIAAAAAAAPVSAAPLVDGFAIERGHSASTHSDVAITRLSVQKRWNEALLQGSFGRLVGYWELSAGLWDNHSLQATNSHLLDVGLTPVFRYEFNGWSDVMPYVEGGVGARVLSHSSVSEFRQFGSAFEFGDHIGAGACLGASGQYDLSYRFQHHSNACICAPNKGMNFHLVRFGIRL